MTFAIGGRGCGNMKADGLYITWSVGSHGIPINKLILDPIWRLDRAKMGIGTQGMTFLPQLDRNGNFVYNQNGDLVYDLYDHIGEDHYKYKADFYEEVCWGGMSRRIPKTAKFSLLTPDQSLHFLCHSNGAISANSIAVVRESLNKEMYPDCLKAIQEHELPLPQNFTDTCSAMWYHEHYKKDTTGTVRSMPSFDYHVYPQSEKVEFDYGAFMVFPIGKFVGTMTKSGDISDQMEKAREELSKKGFDVTMLNLNIDEEETE